MKVIKAIGLVVLVWLMAGAGGCAKYEYQIVEPEALARRVGYAGFERFEIPPLVYHFRAYENHLILRVENPTSEPILLVGEQSVVVSPDGQSHPLRSGTIAPGSFIKLILPPIKPRLERSGPTFGIGVGYSTGRAGVMREGPIGSLEEPKYLYVVEDEALYWEWEGETDVRMNLVFRRGEQTFSQGFVVRRVKVK